MLKIEIRTIPHENQRPEIINASVADWHTTPGGVDLILVSDLGNSDYEFLVAIHECIEQYLCNKRGITAEMVDKFDNENLHLEDQGRSPRAPYHKEHMCALRVERVVAKEMGIDWDKYEQKLGDTIPAEGK